MDEAKPSNPESNEKSDDWRSWTPEKFLTVLIPELRTPLMVIKGYVAILADDDRIDMHPKAIEVISKSVENLEILLNDMADYNKLRR